MALKGNVETLSLVEIFEILHAAGHSGQLKVEHEGTSKTLQWYKGVVYYPKKDRKPTYKLGNLLLHHTKLTQAQLNAGLRIQRETRGLLGEVLIQQGFITDDDLQRVIAVRFREEVFDLFLWRHASFEFVKDVVPEGLVEEIEAGTALPLPPPGIVMEAANRVDEWKRIHRAIPSLKLVCEEKPASGLKIASILGENKIDPAIARFDGKRNLAQIFEAWEHTFFDSHRVVFTLLQAGLIAPVPPPKLVEKVREAVAAKDFGLALRLYESAIECVESLDAGLRINEVLFGPKALPPDQKVALAMRTTGKKALYVILGLFEHGALGKVSVFDGGNRRSLTFTREALGIETTGASVTPDVSQYAARRGLITQEQVDEVRKKRKETKRHVQSVLLDDGYITQEDWTRILTDKLVDEIFDVFFWTDPHVEFKNGPEALVWGQGPAGLRLQMPYSVPGFLDELLKNLDRVRRYLREVPSVRTIFVEVPGGPHHDHREVLALFEGRNSVNDILKLTGWARRDLLLFLHRSLDAGDLRPLTPAEYRERVEQALGEGRFKDAQALCRSAIDAEVEAEHFHLKLDQAETGEEEALPSVLEGDFETVSLAEILQSMQRKQLSGSLECSAEARAKTIYFEKGKIYVLRMEEKKTDFAADFLGEDAASMFDDTFGGDLIAKGLVSEDEISEDLAIEIKTEIWEMFLWEDAKFVFTRNVLPPEFYSPSETTTKLMLQTDAFLLEACRRINEWEELRSRIPDPNVVFRFASAELKMEAIGRGNAELLYLLDGRRSLDEVIRVSGQARTEVYRIVADLEAEGFVGRVGSGETVA